MPPSRPLGPLGSSVRRFGDGGWCWRVFNTVVLVGISFFAVLRVKLEGVKLWGKLAG